MSPQSIFQTRVISGVIASAVLISAIARPVFAQDAQAGQKQNSTDKQLFEDLNSALQGPLPGKRSIPGEDLGVPSKDRTPLAEIGRQMRQVESRLRERDTSATTRQLQSDILERLT